MRQVRLGQGQSALRKTRPLVALTSLLVLIQVGLPLSAKAQAMMEYGGLMAMPKAVPSGGTVNMLTNPYRTIENKMPGSANNASGSSPGATPNQNANPNSAVTVDALGTVTIDPKKAQILGAKALKQFEQAKAMVAAKPQDLKGAEAVLREAINTRNSIWGYDDPMMPKMLTLMGEIYAKQKHISESEACYKNALVYITKKQGSGSFERLDTLAKLGTLYSENGNPKEAVQFFQQVTQIKERQLGASAVNTMQAKLQWANVAAAAGKPDADSLYKGLKENLEQSDKSKPGYKEVQEGFVKSYGAYLAKEGKGEAANDLEKNFKQEAASPSQAATAIPAEVTEAKIEKAEKIGKANKVDKASAPEAIPAAMPAANTSSSPSASVGQMTMEQLINADSKKSKSKSKN
ncbi:hypothetical protein BH11CYA1_BH11CYA1_14230 [soil metagenome]